jgi:hypothetical protein
MPVISDERAAGAFLIIQSNTFDVMFVSIVSGTNTVLAFWYIR